MLRLGLSAGNSGISVRIAGANSFRQGITASPQKISCWRFGCICTGFLLGQSLSFLRFHPKRCSVGSKRSPKRTTRNPRRKARRSLLNWMKCGIICTQKKTSLDLEGLLPRYQSTHRLGMRRSRQWYIFKTLRTIETQECKGLFLRSLGCLQRFDTAGVTDSNQNANPFD